MRVCLISREYPPDTGWGGIGTFTYHLANGLSQLGHEIEVISLAGNKPAYAEGELSKLISVHRIKPQEIVSPTGLLNFCLPVTRPMLGEVCALWGKFLERHLIKPFDVVEAPEHYAEGVFPAITKVAPLVLRLHTPHSKLLAERFHNFSCNFDHQIIAMLERIAMVSADLLISPSQDLARYVSADINYPLDEIAIVRNPVDVNHFCPEGRRALEANGKVTVLFVGRLEPRKGIYHLMEAVAPVLQVVPNARFVCLGSDTMTAKGNSSVLQELTNKLNSKGVGHAVTFIQHVPLEEMPNYYRSADVSILPSLYDNAPCTALEAMSCGKPVIGTAAGGTSEYVISGRCGLIVPPADADVLANALIQLLQDSEQRERMGRYARQHVVDNFTCIEVAQQTVEHYKLALQKFSAEYQGPLYRKDPQVLLSDVGSLVKSAEDMLYDLLYVRSWRFRFQHWYRRARSHPKEFWTKAIKG